MKHYIGIAGTNRAGSTNKKLIAFIKDHFKDQFVLEQVDISGLPIFYKTPNHALPPAVPELADKIVAADGVIISTPEYDHSVPAVLQTALEWLSYGDHPLAGKPVLVTGASFGTLGTSRAQLQLRRMLDAPELGANLMANSDFMVAHSLTAFDEDGNLKDPELVDRLEKLLADFDCFVDVTAKLTYQREDALKQAYAADVANEDKKKED